MAVGVAANRKLFDCRTCHHRYCDDSNPAPWPRWTTDFRGERIDMRTCPLPRITTESAALLRLFRFYEQRVLPQAGGLLDQPHGYIQAMEIIAADLAEMEKEKRDG